MKKVLFVIESPRIGGSVTSLLNLLSLWDSEEFKADLFFLYHDGALLQRAASLHLLPEERLVSAALCPKSALKGKGLRAHCVRVCFTLARRVFGARKATHWVYRHSARKLSGKYDVVVAYQESVSTEYAQYIDAPMRVTWCHSNYLEHVLAKGASVESLKALYETFNRTVCVSEIIKEDMINTLQLPRETVQVIYNTIPPLYIREQAAADGEPIETRAFTLVSCGRFVHGKRFDRVVKAAAALLEAGVDFIWYILGNGEEYATVEQQVREQGLTEHVILTGVKSNPFRYIGKADCFVMTSENEGQPMVLNEAMTLGVPVITTDFPSARETVTDGVNALIAPNTDDGLTETVLKFVQNEALCTALKQGVDSFEYDNASIIRQILQLISADREEKESCI